MVSLYTFIEYVQLTLPVNLLSQITIQKECSLPKESKIVYVIVHT